MAQQALAELKEGFIQRKNYEQQYTEKKFNRASLYAKYVKAQEDEASADKLRKWASVADKAREALKAAPKLVAMRNLQKLESSINELLQVFGVDFFVKASDDGSLSFTAEFFDGRKQPARRLSYGQKTVLALAFRVAVNALFAEEIGLLALDEPTAYLDQQRIKALAPVLEKLRELSTARGLQCLLVTHETSLIHLFESTVELDV
jgi:exonuclease SbcC